MFTDLSAGIGRRSVPPSVVAAVMVLQRLDGLSDHEATDRSPSRASRKPDVRWRYAAGAAAVDVHRAVGVAATFGRIACATFQHRMGQPRWVKTITCANRPGAYLPVLEPGDIWAGDPVTVKDRPAHGVTVAGLPGVHDRADAAARPGRDRRLPKDLSETSRSGYRTGGSTHAGRHIAGIRKTSYVGATRRRFDCHHERPRTGVIVYGCGPDEAVLLHEMAPRLGVTPTITAAAVSEANIDLASGNRCISVGHKARVSNPTRSRSAGPA